MRWAVDAAAMRAIDQQAIGGGIPGLWLMERAGTAVSEAVVSLAASHPGRVVVLCGPGNNGGDGLVAARLLRGLGHDVSAVLVGSGRLSGDAGTNLQKAREAGVPVVDVAATGDIAAVDALVESSGIVVDALLGTGSSGPPRGHMGDVVRMLASRDVPVVAADIPTGVDSDTGQAPGPAVRARTTVTMGLVKTGMLFHPGCALVGRLVVADIGFPADLVSPPERGVEILEPGDLAWFLPPVSSTAHKGDCGRIVVVAGSTGMTGAAALCCQAALRAGAGLVHLAIPEHLNSVVEVMLPETITIPLPERDGQHCEAGVEALCRHLESADVLVLGPGLGRGPGPAEMVAALLDSWRGPLVLDADGLFHVGPERGFSGPTVLTPHLGEMARLAGEDARDIAANRLRCTQREATGRNAVVLLKGVPTVVADPSGRSGVNLTGNAGLATGGSGDVLAGVIAGLLAQGAAAYPAAMGGAFLHGIAADCAAAEMPHASILPTDLLRFLPKALRRAGFGDRSEPRPWWKPSEPAA